MAIIVGRRDNNPFTSEVADVYVQTETAGQKVARDVNTIKTAVDVVGDIGSFAGKAFAAGSYLFGEDQREVARANAAETVRAKLKGERDAVIRGGAAEIEAGKRAMDEARKLYSEDTDPQTHAPTNLAAKEGLDKPYPDPSSQVQRRHPVDQAVDIASIEFPEVAKMVEGQTQIPQGQLQLSKDKLVMDTPPDVSHLGRGMARPSVSIADKGPVPTYNLDAVDASGYQEAGPTKKMAAYRGGMPTVQTDEQIEERARAAGLAAAAKIITPKEAKLQLRQAYRAGDWKKAEEVMANLRTSGGYGIRPKTFSDVLFGTHITAAHADVEKLLNVDRWANRKSQLLGMQLKKAKTKNERLKYKRDLAEHNEWMEMKGLRRRKVEADVEGKETGTKLKKKELKWYDRDKKSQINLRSSSSSLNWIRRRKIEKMMPVEFATKELEHYGKQLDVGKKSVEMPYNRVIKIKQAEKAVRDAEAAAIKAETQGERDRLDIRLKRAQAELTEIRGKEAAGAKTKKIIKLAGENTTKVVLSKGKILSGLKMLGRSISAEDAALFADKDFVFDKREGASGRPEDRGAFYKYKGYWYISPDKVGHILTVIDEERRGETSILGNRSALRRLSSEIMRLASSINQNNKNIRSLK